MCWTLVHRQSRAAVAHVTSTVVSLDPDQIETRPRTRTRLSFDPSLYLPVTSILRERIVEGALMTLNEGIHIVLSGLPCAT